MTAPRTAALGVALCLSLAGCGGEESGGPPDPPAIGQIIEASADAMAAVDTARFEMERSGAPVKVQWLEFDSALGVYRAPDEAKAALRGRVGGITIEAGSISIGDRTWLSNPLTGAWEPIDPDVAFNPAVVFDPEVGWRAVLLELVDAALVGSVEEDGEARWVITGIIPSRRIETLTVGLVENQEVPVEMLVEPETFRLRRVSFTTVGVDGPSDWVIRLSRFGEPVSIEPPEEG